VVISQGFLGYALTSVMGPIVAEIFEGPHYGSIFGTITVALIGGGAMGALISGAATAMTARKSDSCCTAYGASSASRALRRRVSLQATILTVEAW
jgi:MFS family permease